MERTAPALRAICTGGLGALIAPSPPSVLAATRNSYLFAGSAPRWQWSLDAAPRPGCTRHLRGACGRVRVCAG